MIYERSGAELARSTLAGWVGASRGLLEPLSEAQRRYSIQAAKAHGDDTPALAPGLGRTRAVRLCAYVRDDQAASTRRAIWRSFAVRCKLMASCGVSIGC
ncbi:MAG: IS66 family transposase [Terriglobales bacterium]